MNKRDYSKQFSIGLLILGIAFFISCMLEFFLVYNYDKVEKEENKLYAIQEEYLKKNRDAVDEIAKSYAPDNIEKIVDENLSYNSDVKIIRIVDPKKGNN